MFSYSNGMASNVFTVCLALLMLVTSIPASWAAEPPPAVTPLSQQAAEILAIKPELEKLIYLEQKGETYSEESLALRTYIYTQILKGVFDTSDGCNTIERELVYTYGLLQRQQKKQQNAGDFLNLLNFVQFGTIYTIEPIVRLRGQFEASGILTGVAAGTGIVLPTTNILYGKLSKTSNVSPPKGFRHVVSGNPVNKFKFPKSVELFMEMKPPGAAVSRRAMLREVWRKRFGTNEMTSEALHSLLDGKSKNAKDLNDRIVHLWALHTVVQDLDSALLQLMRFVVPLKSPLDGAVQNDPPLQLDKGATEALNLLGIRREAAALADLNKSGENGKLRRELEAYVLGKIMLGSLEMRCAVDRIYEELNYAYDVALAELESKRARGLQRNYEANFIQINTFGAIASLLYLKGYSKPGDEMFVIGDSMSMALSTLALLQLRGGKRAIDTPPNSLADFLDLNPPNQYCFSPFVSSFLASKDPYSKEGLTHKGELLAIWKRDKVATINYDDPENQMRLSAMPGAKKDTIKILRNRANLLASLRVRFQFLDQELLDALEATEPGARISTSTVGSDDSLRVNNEPTWRTAQLIGAINEANRINELRRKGASAADLFEPRLSFTRQLLKAKLEVRKTSANIEQEIAAEQTEVDNLKRYRDMSVQLTNIGNFYQIGVLGVISDGLLGLSGKANSEYRANVVNIVSGSMVTGLGTFAYLLRSGGVRLKSPPPNMLGPCLSVESPAKKLYAPLLIRYLNDEDPLSSPRQTRAAELLEFWKNSRILSIDIGKAEVQEKVSASGKHHRWWNERIKLIENRINMLFDLRSVINMLEGDLSKLMETVS